MTQFLAPPRTVSGTSKCVPWYEFRELAFSEVQRLLHRITSFGTKNPVCKRLSRNSIDHGLRAADLHSRLLLFDRLLDRTGAAGFIFKARGSPACAATDPHHLRHSSSTFGEQETSCGKRNAGRLPCVRALGAVHPHGHWLTALIGCKESDARGARLGGW